MSDYICFEIQAEIMRRLPVRSLIRYRSVSRPWKTLIDISEFNAEYFMKNTQQQQQQLLIRCIDPQNSEQKIVSVVDDDTFPLRKYSVTVPISVKLLLNKPGIVIGSQGLFCLYNFYETHTVVLWNPLISKSVVIEVSDVRPIPYENVVGFWVCPKTSGIKLVKVSFFLNDEADENLDDSVPWQVKVFTLSSGVWRSPLCSSLPRNSIELTPNQVNIDRFLYWHAFAYELDGLNLIMTFDMISEEFTEVCLPDSLAHGSHISLDISKLRESLVVFDYKMEVEKRVCTCNVWMMENGDPKSFTMLFTINMTDTSIEYVLGFRVSGELVTVMKKYNSNDDEGALYVYDPYSKNISYVDICGKEFSYYASFYLETLLLLDQ